MRKRRDGQLGEFWLSKRAGSNCWYVTWLDRDTRQTRRQTTGTDDYAEAERQLAERFTLAETLEEERPADVPLTTVLDRYWHEHASKLPSKGSRQTSRTAVELLRELVGPAMVADFGRKEQERIVGVLRERGLSDGYIRRTFDTARAALRRAYANEEIASVPPFIRIPKSEPRDRVLSIEEAAALFNAAKQESQFRYLLLAFGTAARPAAILELTRVQCDIRGRRIRLNPHGRKQNKKRRPTIPMAETLALWLKDWRDDHIVNHNGQPYSREGWKAIFKRLAERAGVPDVSAYTIRHTMATELAKRGVPWSEIEMVLGHAIPSTTSQYVHYAPEFLQKAVAAIDAYFSELSQLVHKPLLGVQIEDQPLPDSVLRASCVPVGPSDEGRMVANSLIRLVGMRGFEPPTPTSRT
jgi:integrase